MWNCHCIETFNFSNYWATNAMYPYNDSLAFSETIIGLIPIACPIHAITKNNILAINITSLLLVWVAASVAYTIFKKLFKDSLSALIGSLIFAFNPWLAREFTLGRIHVLGILWFPIIFYANLAYWRQNKRKYLFVLIFFYLWTFLISIYMGIFLCVILSSWNLIWFLIDRKIFTAWKIAKWLTAIFIVWLFMSPILYMHYQAGKKLGINRTLEQQIQYTGQIWSWFVVSEDNWLWGQVAKIIPIKDLQDSPIENAMFPGLTALSLFIISFLIKGMPSWFNSLKWTALIASILAIGPYTIGIKRAIPLPFLAFWYLFPPMKATRNPHRFSIFAILIISFLAAALLSSLKLPRKKAIIYKTLIMVFACVELWNFAIPNEHYSYPINEIYQSLSQKKNNTTVVELPSDPVHFQTKVLFGSTFHWKTTINGITSAFPPVQYQLAHELFEFPSTHSIKLLQALNVDYIIIHPNEYVHEKLLERIPLIIYRPELKLINKIQTIYSLHLKKGELLRYLNPEKDINLLTPSIFVEGKESVCIEITSALNHIIFNQYSPVKFAYRSSQPWFIKYKTNTDKDYQKIPFYAPALFHKYNNRITIPIMINRNSKQLIIKVDIMGIKEIAFHKYIKVLPSSPINKRLPKYLSLPVGYNPIPIDQIRYKIETNLPEKINLIKGDYFDAAVKITNLSPYYWHATSMTKFPILIKLNCDAMNIEYPLKLPHDLYLNDVATINLHLNVNNAKMCNYKIDIKHKHRSS